MFYVCCATASASLLKHLDIAASHQTSDCKTSYSRHHSFFPQCRSIRLQVIVLDITAFLRFVVICCEIFIIIVLCFVCSCVVECY